MLQTSEQQNSHRKGIVPTQSRNLFLLFCRVDQCQLSVYMHVTEGYYFKVLVCLLIAIYKKCITIRAEMLMPAVPHPSVVLCAVFQEEKEVVPP